MKIAILGAGKQARGAIQYLLEKSIDELHIFDQDADAAKHLQTIFEDLSSKNAIVKSHCINAHNPKDLVDALKPCDLAFNALPYFFALKTTKAAIQAKTNLVDLGGNNEMVAKQFELDREATAAGVTIVPDCGVAPGLVSLLVADAVNSVKGVKHIKVYVGGLPKYPEYAGVLQYGDFFSIEGLINEYIEPVSVLREGKQIYIQPLTELEEVSITSDKTFWTTLEAFTTSGGISTLPLTYKDQLQTLEYKTLRFPGHLRQLQLLKQLDLLTAPTFAKLLKPCDDQIFLKVVARDGENRSPEQFTREKTYVLHYVKSEYSDVTAMMACTAYPAAMVMLQLNDKTIPPGVWKQEEIINSQTAIEELRNHGLNIQIEERIKHGA
jgi:lysine 6-dehydrogenase